MRHILAFIVGSIIWLLGLTIAEYLMPHTTDRAIIAMWGVVLMAMEVYALLRIFRWKLIVNERGRIEVSN